MAIPVAAVQFGITIGGIIARYFSDPARDLIEDFGDTFGCRNEPWSGRTVCGLDALHTYLIEQCPGTYTGDPSRCPGELLWIEGTQQIGRRDVRRAQAWVERVVAFLQSGAGAQRPAGGAILGPLTAIVREPVFLVAIVAIAFLFTRPK